MTIATGRPMRNSDYLALKNDAPRSPDVAVIGSGASGMGAAYRLHEAGHRVRVFERGPRVGGRMQTFHRDGFLNERGPIQIAGSYSSLIGILRDSGLINQLIPASAMMDLYAPDGRWHRFDIHHMQRDLLRSDLLSAREKLDMLKLARDAFKYRKYLDPEDLSKMAFMDGLSADEYSRARFTEHAHDVLIHTIARAFIGAAPEEVSAVDLIFSSAAFAGKQKYFALRDGMGSYAGQLSKLFDVKTRAEVIGVVQKSNQVEVTWRDADNVERTETFGGVVIATEHDAAAEIHSALDEWRKDFLANRIKHAQMVGLHIATGARLNTDASIVYACPTSDVSQLQAINLEHNKVPGRQPTGKGMVTVYASVDWSRDLLHEDDEKVTQKLMDMGSRLIPTLGNDVIFTDVSRWANTWMVPYPGYWKAMKEFRERSGQDRLIQLAGDYFATSNINTASTSGEAAARRLLNAQRAH